MVRSQRTLHPNGGAAASALHFIEQNSLRDIKYIRREKLRRAGYQFGLELRNQVEVFAVTNQVFFESQLPDAFTREKMSLRKLPLFELTETLIEIFNLGREIGELAYLQAFQDLVLGSDP